MARQHLLLAAAALLAVAAQADWPRPAVILLKFYTEYCIDHWRTVGTCRRGTRGRNRCVAIMECIGGDPV